MKSSNNWWDITNSLREIKRIIGRYYEQLYANKLDNGVPPKFTDETLVSILMLSGSGPLGDNQVMKAETSYTGLVPLQSRLQRASFLPSTMWAHREKMVAYEPGGGLSPDTKCTSALLLDFPVSRTMGSTFLVFYKPFYGILLYSSSKGLTVTRWNGQIASKTKLLKLNPEETENLNIP